MRGLFVTLLLLGLPALAWPADAPAGHVIKVLPLLLNLQGQDATSPSLFDRDVYQAYLRQHTNEISAIRFDVLWKAADVGEAKLKLRVDLSGSGSGGTPYQTVLEQGVAPGHFRRWTSLTLADTNYPQLGKLLAWRVTLWADDRLLSEQKSKESFLW